MTVALARPGWTVECACSGYDALERFAGDTRGFDVLVTDHSMPGMDGLELVRRLRELGFTGAVVVVSAHINAAAAEGYRALGAGQILHKPVDVRALRAAVEHAPLVPPLRSPPEFFRSPQSFSSP